MVASGTPQLARFATRSAKRISTECPRSLTRSTGRCGELPSLLARSASGLEFIYRTLDLVAARYRLRDLVVVVERDRTSHRSSASAGRRWVLNGPVTSYLGRPRRARGLYAEPPVVGPVAAACVTSLVELALRLDLLMHDASHDALTGLLNRRSYELLLDQAVSRARRYGWPFALVLLDLDDFKVVNDRYGHAAGDAALQAVGRRAARRLAWRRRGCSPGWGRVCPARGGGGQRRRPITPARAAQKGTGALGAGDERVVFCRCGLLSLRHR